MAERELIRPPAGALERVGRTLAGAPVSLASTVAGIAGTMPDPGAAWAPEAQRHAFGVAREERFKRLYDDAFTSAVQHVRSRLEQPGTTRVRLDFADLWSGTSTLGQRLINADPTQADKVDGFLDHLAALARERFAQGEEVPASVVGGTAAQIAHPLEAAEGTPVSMALNLLPLAKSARLGTAAAGARMGGRVGGALEAGARAFETPGQFVRAGETAFKTAADWVGKPQLESRLQQLVQSGALTAQEAGEVLAKQAPSLVSRVVEPGPGGAASPLQRGVRAVKGAAVGAVLGDVLPPGVGAVVGAVLPEAVSRAWGSLSPAARASFTRKFGDLTAQPTPEATEIARGIVEPHRAVRSELPAYFDAAAGIVKDQGIQPAAPTPATTVRVPGALTERVDVQRTGEMLPHMPEADLAVAQGAAQLLDQRTMNDAKTLLEVLRAKDKLILDKTSPAYADLQADVARAEGMAEEARVNLSREKEHHELGKDARALNLQKLRDNLAEVAKKHKDDIAAYEKQKSVVQQMESGPLSKEIAETAREADSLLKKWRTSMEQVQAAKQQRGGVDASMHQAVVDAYKRYRFAKYHVKEFPEAAEAATQAKAAVEAGKQARTAAAATSKEALHQTVQDSYALRDVLDQETAILFDLKNALDEGVAPEREMLAMQARQVDLIRAQLRSRRAMLANIADEHRERARSSMENVERARGIVEARRKGGPLPPPRRLADEARAADEALDDAIRRQDASDAAEASARMDAIDREIQAWATGSQQEGLNAMRERLGATDPLRPEARVLDDWLGRLRPEVRELWDKVKAVGQTPNEQALAAGLATKGADAPFVSVPEDARLKQLISRTQESVNKSRAPDKQFRFADVARWFTDTVRVDSIEMLRSPGFRAAVVEDLAQQLPKHARKEFVEAATRDIIEKVLPQALGPEPLSRSYTIGGVNMPLEVVLAKARQFLARDPARLREAMGEAIERTGIHTAIKTAQQSLAQGMWNEHNRFVHTDVAIQNVAEYATNVAAGMLGKGQAFPQIMPHPPAKVAGLLNSGAYEIAAELGRRGVTATPQQVAALVKQFTLYGKKGLEEFGWKSEADSVIGKVLTEGSKFGDTPPLPAGHKVYVAPGLSETLHGELSFMKALDDANSISHRWMRRMKLNITVRNPVAHVNNFTANTMLTSLVEGRDPVSVVAEATKEHAQWRAWQRGEQVPPEQARKYQGIARTGVVDASNIDADWELLQHASGATGALHQADKLAKQGYKLGDALFKVRVASHTYDRIFTSLGALEDGKTAWLDFGKGRLQPVKKVGDKFEVNGKTVGADSERLADTVARAAIEPAKALFFDHGDKPLFLQWATGPKAGVGSILNPMMTWTYKSLGLPKYLLDFDGTVIPRTDSPAVLASQAGLAMQTALKRTGLLNAQAAMLSEHRDELRKLVGSDRTLGAMQLAEITDPRNVTYRDASPSSAFGPSALLWRLGVAGISAAASMVGADELAFPTGKDGALLPEAQLEPWQKKLRKVMVEHWSGEDIKPRDAAASIGITGGFLGDLLLGAAAAERAGQEYDWGKGLVRLGALLATGIAATGVDITLGLATDSSASSRFVRTEGLNTQLGREDAVRFVARKSAGVGWRDAFVRGDLGKYMDWVGVELEGSLTRGIEKHGDRENALRQQALREGRAEDAARHASNLQGIRKSLARYGMIIREVIGDERVKGMDALKMLAPSGDAGAQSTPPPPAAD